jgi:hypothetical protein
MEDAEAIHLSEAIGKTSYHVDLLSQVRTSNYLAITRGPKSVVNPMLAQLNRTKAVYWRNNRVNRVEYQKVIIMDQATAALAMMFGDLHEIRHLTISELALARNEIDIPWLPSIKGYIKDREHNATLERLLEGLRKASWGARDLGLVSLRADIEAIEMKAKRLRRQTV